MAACLATPVTAESEVAETRAGNAALLPAHTATYEVYRRGSKAGEIHVELSCNDNGIWFYETRTEATAFMARMLGLSAEESAHFIWRDGDILPLTYHHVARGPGRTRFWQHAYDWDAGYSDTRTYEGDHRIELEPGLVDPLTLRLALAVRLHEQENRDTDQHFRVLERDEIEDQAFFHQGTESVEVGAGCFEAVKMKRFRREGSSRNYYSWHAAEFHWMPVRIVQLSDGEEQLDIRLAEHSSAGRPADRAKCPGD